MPDGEGRLRRAVSSLAYPDYRSFAGGQAVRLLGLWMQFVAQDWLVLELSHDSPTALGFVSALQYAPVLLLTLYSGGLADRVDNRRIMLATNTACAVLTLLLGAVATLGTVRLWHVYVIAAGIGVASALEHPARQAIVSRLVPDADLPNALAVLSGAFNASRLVGPSLAGVLIAALGSGPVFLVIAVTFAGPLIGLWRIRARTTLPAADGDRRVRVALRHLRHAPDLLLPLALMFVVCLFGLNVHMKLALLARTGFHVGATAFGLLGSAMAVGSLAGAAAGAWRRDRPGAGLVVGAAAGLALAQLAMAAVPSFVLVAVLLVPVGFGGVLFTQAATQRVALGVAQALRGRVLSVVTLVMLGTAPASGLLIGWSAELWGARGAIASGAALTLAGAVAGAGYLVLRRDGGPAPAGQSPDGICGGARRGADRSA